MLDEFKIQKSEMMNGILNGFSGATSNGPLCEEPMQGACFIIQQISLEEEQKQDKPQDEEEKKEDEEEEVKVEAAATSNPFGSLGGQVISIVKDLCKRSFLNA